MILQSFLSRFLQKDLSKALSISRSFERVKQEGRLALMPFVMAGDPDLKTTEDILLQLQNNGADMIELGIPYSDPLADGPTIQLAASRALSLGTSPKNVLSMLGKLRGRLSIPVILFTYSNPLLNIGMEEFCQEASKAGAAGIVVPDLPLEEAEKLSKIAAKRQLDLILLVAPTTPKDRMRLIAEKSKGFTYLVSVTGVTGERLELETRVEKLIQELKGFSDTPVAVGFGISDPSHIKAVRNWGADGAIVGSALVKRISNAKTGLSVDEAGKFCKELRQAAG